MTTPRIRIMTLNIGVLLAAMLAAAGARAEQDRPERIPFSVAGGNVAVGFFYAPEGEHAERCRRHERRTEAACSCSKPVLIMLHGESSSHTEFDFAPGFRAAPEIAHQGFPVVALDRVGYGESSHPNGDTLNFTTSAGYVHEVVQTVRNGALGFVPTSVALLGSSAGSYLTIVEAGTYHDVDGVIVGFDTALLQPTVLPVLAANASGWFAQGDYFDYGADFRAQFFYSEPFAVQSIIDLDNATRTLIPRAELQSALANGSGPFRSLISVPVLLLQADSDHIFVPQDDSALFSGSPDVEFVVLDRAGHKAFEHPTSRQAAVHEVVRWLEERL